MQSGAKELCDALRAEQSFVRVRAQCESLLTVSANVFERPRLTAAASSRSPFEQLLFTFSQFALVKQSTAARQFQIFNWPLNERSAVLRRDSFNQNEAAAFLQLFQLFANSQKNGAETVKNILEQILSGDGLRSIFSFRLPHECFPLVETVQKFLLVSAARLDRNRPAEKALVQQIYEQFPVWLWNVIDSVTLVTDLQELSVAERVRSAAAELHTIFRTARFSLCRLFLIPRDPAVGVAAQTDLQSMELLKPFFSVSLKAAFFTANSGELLGAERTSGLWEELILLIVYTLATLRSLQETQSVGLQFAEQLLNALRVPSDRKETEVPHAGAARFFRYLQDLQRSLAQQTSLRSTACEEMLESIAGTFAVENVLGPAEGLAKEVPLQVLKFRSTRGMPVTLPENITEKYPNSERPPISADFVHPFCMMLNVVPLFRFL